MKVRDHASQPYNTGGKLLFHRPISWS